MKKLIFISLAVLLVIAMLYYGKSRTDNGIYQKKPVSEEKKAVQENRVIAPRKDIPTSRVHVETTKPVIKKTRMQKDCIKAVKDTLPHLEESVKEKIYAHEAEVVDKFESERAEYLNGRISVEEYRQRLADNAKQEDKFYRDLLSDEDYLKWRGRTKEQADKAIEGSFYSEKPDVFVSFPELKDAFLQVDELSKYLSNEQMNAIVNVKKQYLASQLQLEKDYELGKITKKDAYNTSAMLDDNLANDLRSIVGEQFYNEFLSE